MMLFSNSMCMAVIPYFEGKFHVSVCLTNVGVAVSSKVITSGGILPTA